MRPRSLLLVAAAVIAGLLVLAVQAQSSDEAGALQLGWSAPGADGLPDGWKPLTFPKIKRHTRYSMVREGNGYVVKAESDAAASGLVHEVRLDAARYPTVRWQWKVENLIAKGDV